MSEAVLSCAGLAKTFGLGEVAVPVLGAFNVANLLAVIGTLLASGVGFDCAMAAVARLSPVTGRLERLGGGAGGSGGG